MKLININNIILIKKKIIKNIKLMKKNDYIEILKIIKKNDISYTENINGIFIDLNLINDTIILEIYNFINFIISKNKELLQTEKRINNKKKEYGIKNME
jgi:hypothetical protein